MTGRKGNKLFWFFILHLALLIYSTASLFSKSAAMQPFLSISFLAFYAGMILALGIYALLWQQVIKRLPLTFAYANKAITVVWGVLLGKLVFLEQISVRQGIACGIVMLGTVLYVFAEKKEGES